MRSRSRVLGARWRPDEEVVGLTLPRRAGDRAGGRDITDAGTSGSA